MADALKPVPDSPLISGAAFAGWVKRFALETGISIYSATPGKLRGPVEQVIVSKMELQRER